METLSEIQRAITRLSPAELYQLSEWIQEQEADAWDAQIEADAKAGKLDALIAKVDESIEAGRSVRMP